MGAITDDEAAPTPAEVKANNNANKVGTATTAGVDIAAAGSQTCTVTALTANTDYDIYLYAEDDESTPNTMDQNAVTATKQDVSVPAADTAAPALSGYSKSCTGTQCVITFTSDEVGKVWCTAITDDEAAPTPAEVKANNNANKVGTATTAGVDIAAAGSQTCTVTALT